MQFLHGKSTIDFMGKRKLAMAFSLSLIVIAITSLAVRGLSLGIDFTGGYLIEMQYEHSVDLGNVRKSLSDGGCSPSLTLFPCSSNMNSFIRRHFQITNKKEFLDKKHFRILLIYTITQILEAIFINQIY